MPGQTRIVVWTPSSVTVIEPSCSGEVMYRMEFLVMFEID
jgi:hypothetical protein